MRRGRRQRGRRWGEEARETALTRSALLGPPHGDPEAVRRQLRDLARALADLGEEAAAAVAWALCLEERARLLLLARPRVCDVLRERLVAVCAAVAARTAGAAAELSTIVALVNEGRRRAALAAIRAALVGGEDAELVEIAALVLALGVRGPRLDLKMSVDPAADAVAARLLASGALRVALGDRVTLGRVGASILVPGGAVAPEHAALWREPSSGVVVADLGTTAGTTRGGAPLVGPAPVGDGVRIELAGRVPISLAPLDAARPGSPVVIDAAGEAFLASLGVLSLGGGGELRPPEAARWTLWMEQTARGRGEGPAADAFVLPWVMLRPPADAQPALDGAPAASEIDLCFGDALRAAPDAPPVLVVRPPAER